MHWTVNSKYDGPGEVDFWGAESSFHWNCQHNFLVFAWERICGEDQSGVRILHVENKNK